MTHGSAVALENGDGSNLNKPLPRDPSFFDTAKTLFGKPVHKLARTFRSTHHFYRLSRKCQQCSTIRSRARSTVTSKVVRLKHSFGRNVIELIVNDRGEKVGIFSKLLVLGLIENAMVVFTGTEMASFKYSHLGKGRATRPAASTCFHYFSRLQPSALS